MRISRSFLLVFVALLLGFLPRTAHAQADSTLVGTCEPALADAYLDAGNVRARILNNGNLFWRGDGVYEVPKGGGVHAVFVGGLWIGGLVDGELHLAGSTYGPYEFWPGPLDEDGRPPSDCTPFDRLYEVTRDDLADYNRSRTLTNNLRAWPFSLGAPVVDGDGIAGNYNLPGGDRPALMGDQSLWWVMNDRGNAHRRTRGRPMGLEVQGTAFAFDAAGALGNTTFYCYRLLNRNMAPLEEAYFGFFLDPDLGTAHDDYFGSDTTLQMAFVYNADDDDEDFYGEHPPALGVTVLQGPTATDDGQDNDRDGLADEPGERLGMTSFLTYFGGGGGVQTNPSESEHHYYYMQARWLDGGRITVGGDGRNFSNIPTSFMFFGNPVTKAFWSEFNVDGKGRAIPPQDGRFIMATGPFTLQPGEEQEVVLALVWSRGDDHLDSVRKLREDTAFIRGLTATLLTPRPGDVHPYVESYPLGFAQNYPNPFRESTVIRYSLPQTMQVRLTVFDVLGRTVATLVDRQQAAGVYEAPFEAGSLPTGVYIYRLELDHLRFTRRMLLVH